MNDALDTPELAALRTGLREIESRFATRLITPPSAAPDTLYHYTSASGLLGILTSQRLWASDVLFLNDATEVLYGCELIRACAGASAATTTSGRVSRLLDTIEHVLFPVGTVSNFYVACFCTEADLLSQWRGYSGGWGGYAIGLSTREMLQRQDCQALPPTQRFGLRRVMYDPAEQEELLTNLFRDVARTLEVYDQAFPGLEQDVSWVLAHNLFQKLLLECMLTMKSPAFSEEKEWRLIHNGGIVSAIDATASVSFRASESYLVPYVELDVTPIAGPNADQLPVTHIVVGPTRHPELAAKSVQHLVGTRAQVTNSSVPLRP